MTEPTPRAEFHMSSAEFRRHGHALIDWIADYRDRIEELPVLSRSEPGDVRSQLPESAPRRGEPFEEVLSDVENIILPGLTNWQSPSFFAFFPANASYPSVLGELLSAGFGVQGMLWATSPACTELETHVLDWLVPLLGLPSAFLSSSDGGGVIQDTASSATLCALLAARERALRAGASPDQLTAYGSAETHSSLLKAIRIAGLPEEALRFVDVDTQFSLSAESLGRQCADDRAAGKHPFFVCASLGTTSSNAFDPLPQIGPIAEDLGAWLHVDAAMSGTAAICPEFREIHRGLEYADSYCFNAHKWLFTNFDCDCFWVRKRSELLAALSVLPEYLRNSATESGDVLDYRDWQIPLGRRFRALKLWFVIRHYGVEGLQHHVRRHVELAQELHHKIEGDDRFEILAPT
ncbi:MAG: pyridoxal-dependent decarboxylase, partial [Planctomycetota bacterium]